MQKTTEKSVISITTRRLTQQEIALLTKEIRFACDLQYVSSNRWNELTHCYVAEYNGSFAGVCGIYKRRDWVKVGPLVVLQEFRRLGTGKALLKKVVLDFQGTQLFILSSNRIVQHIIESIGFTNLPSLTFLPIDFLFFLFIQLIKYSANIHFIQEFIRKRLTYKRGPSMFYTYGTQLHAKH